MLIRLIALSLCLQIMTALSSACSAQETPVPASDGATTTTTSSESSSYSRGVGFKGANVFAPKYKQRLKNWREQIELGTQKGFLKPEDAERFNNVLNRLTQLEADLAAKNYPKEETDSMEQDFNAFNVDISQAMQPKPVPAPIATPVVAPKPVPAAVVPAKKPVMVVAKKTTAKPAARKSHSTKRHH
jgi:hypothetical protein